MGRDDPPRALAEFEAALALWRGKAYSEVATVTHVAGEVARLEELRLSVIEARCAALLAVGRHELAVPELEALVRAHPLREYGCELLSLTLYRAGRQNEALDVLRTVQRRLADEVGVDPRPALQHLEREILSQVADPQLTSLPAGTPSGTPTTPPLHRVVEGERFVGRESTLRQLDAASVAAAAGRGQVVTVSGEPGIGKTSLLRRFAALAEVPVLWGTCPEHVVAPAWWPWEQVLRSAVAAFPRQAVPAPVAELLARPTRQMATGDALREVETIVEYLTDVSRTVPVVVVLDHLQRADPTSLRMLVRLADAVPASRLLVIVSYSSGSRSRWPRRSRCWPAPARPASHWTVWMSSRPTRWPVRFSVGRSTGRRRTSCGTAPGATRSSSGNCSHS
ncbi:BTAD domain-containing putative transcriptional regulator [Micromonospora sp. M12]